jgi:hypothetical protein
MPPTRATGLVASSAFVVLLAACGSSSEVDSLGQPASPDSSGATMQGSGADQPRTRSLPQCAEGDRPVQYSASIGDTPGGESTPETAVEVARRDKNISPEQRVVNSYFIGEDDRPTPNRSNRKRHEFANERGESKVVLVTEYIGDSWHATQLLGCLSAFTGGTMRAKRRFRGIAALALCASTAGVTGVASAHPADDYYTYLVWPPTAVENYQIAGGVPQVDRVRASIRAGAGQWNILSPGPTFEYIGIRVRRRMSSHSAIL